MADDRRNSGRDRLRLPEPPHHPVGISERSAAREPWRTREGCEQLLDRASENRVDVPVRPDRVEAESPEAPAQDDEVGDFDENRALGLVLDVDGMERETASHLVLPSPPDLADGEAQPAGLSREARVDVRLPVVRPHPLLPELGDAA